MTDTDDLAVLEAAEAKMTPGPWEVRMSIGDWPIYIASAPLYDEESDAGDVAFEMKHDDAFGIVALRNAAPRLLERLAAAEAALREIDALPAGHYRRNGFASADPWVRQRDVRRIVQRALRPAPDAAKEESDVAE